MRVRAVQRPSNASHPRRARQGAWRRFPFRQSGKSSANRTLPSEQGSAYPLYVARAIERDFRRSRPLSTEVSRAFFSTRRLASEVVTTGSVGGRGFLKAPGRRQNWICRSRTRTRRRCGSSSDRGNFRYTGANQRYRSQRRQPREGPISRQSVGVHLKNTVIIGTQWGDEGKGKVVDLTARHFDLVVRFQGGHNAGHSVVAGGKRYALHLLPSGILSPGILNVIANGVVVDPFALVKEMDGLIAQGVAISPENLVISDRAHLIMPYHRLLDCHREAMPGQVKIGTTGRGIGPAYEWKAGRRGIRFCDYKQRDHFAVLLRREIESVHRLYPQIEELKEWDIESTLERLLPVLDRLRAHVRDTVTLLADARRENKQILFEGAQATLLDVDFGTYPYVTSSNSCAAGVTAGAGVPASTIEHTIGIFKAYTSRVGEGPFPSELKDETGDHLRDKGHEYGTTTGRPRRCGWLDLVHLRHAEALNGFTTLAMMKLDVLDELEEIQVCTSYELDGETVQALPASSHDLLRAKPIYDSLPGWRSDTSKVRCFEDLPEQARAYIEYIEQAVGRPVGLVSVGPDREQTIIRAADVFTRGA